MRKGISPLVAAVLLIAVTMTIAGVLSYWTSSFVKTRLEKERNETVMIECAGADFEIYGTPTYDETSKNLSFVLHNKQFIELKDLKALFFYSSGITEKPLNQTLLGNSYTSFTVESVEPNYTQFKVVTHCPGVEVTWPKG